MLNTFGKWLCDEDFAFHGFIIPDADPWFGSDLACGTDPSIWVHGDAMDIVCVVHEMLLRVACRIHNNCDTSCIIDELAASSVSKVVPAVMTAEPINVLQV